MQVPDWLRNVVVFIYAERDGQMQIMGTAFMVYISMGEDGLAPYLVTARHVVEGFAEDDAVHLRLNTTNGPRVDPSWGSWKYHPDPAVDLAVLVLDRTSIPRREKALYAAFDFDDARVTPAMLAERGHTLRPGDEVFLTGLMATWPGDSTNEPFVRFGRLSAIPADKMAVKRGADILRTEALVIEAQAYPGFSGSPVFLALAPEITPGPAGAPLFHEPRIALLGVISRWFPDPDTVAIPSGAKAFTHYGLSAVTPVEKLAELLYDPEIVALRAKYHAATVVSSEPAGITPVGPRSRKRSTRDR